MIIGINGYIGSGKDTVGEIIRYLIANQLGRHNPNIEFNPNKIQYTESGWEIKKFAAKLKQIASIMTGIPVEKFEDQEFKKTYLPDEWAYLTKLEEEIFTDGIGLMFKRMTVREFLQKLGTEAIRDGLHTNAWVNALFADYKPARIELGAKAPIPSESNWIITDCRFPNEAEAIKSRGGIVIRVNREKNGLSVKSPTGVSYDARTGQITNIHPSETSLDTWEFDYILNNNGSIEELVDSVKEMLNEFRKLT